MRILMIIVYLLLVIVGVSFAALNASSVQLNLYYKTVSIPISVLVIITIGLGLLFGFLIGLGRYWRLKIENMRVKNQLKLTEKEIKNLRDIPLKDQH